MNGAMMKATTRFAIAAAFGLVMGVSSARAADLGGNCCADLEERVAELEATTARKGNRKMSLTISGQVHRAIVWWDDGLSSKTYYGLDNRNSSTRLDFAGEAKVTPANKIGFEIQFDNQSGTTTSAFNQWDVDGRINVGVSAVGRQPFTGNNADPYFGGLRYALFYVENDKLGRVTVGRYNMAGAVTTIDLAGISAGAGSSLELVGGALLWRGPLGQYYTMSLSTITDPAANQARQNEIRYDSPTWQGFIYSYSLSEDGSNWGTMLRYANEFSGYRLAAGIGYEHYGQISARQSCVTVGAVACVNPPGYGPVDLAGPAPDVDAWGASVAALHVPTGLFVQGHYIYVNFDEANPATFAPVNGFWGQAANGLRPADQWLIQGGITKNWTGFGNTAFFGEWSFNHDWGAGGGPLAPNGVSYGNGTTIGAQAVNGVTKTNMTMYGFGVTQNVDAAATEIYLDARHFSADITCSAAAAATSPTSLCSGTPGTAPGTKLPTEDMWIIVGGARVKF
jgi:hypothetical protein